MKILLLLALILPQLAFAKAKDLSWPVDTASSKVEWEGRKISGAHNGTLALKSGSLEFNKDALVGGEFVIDMNTLKDIDLTDAAYNKKLVDHLRSEDFFSVEKFPTASFKVTSVKATEAGKYMVTGNLTIKSIEHSVNFPVTTSLKDGEFVADGSVEIDRTLWDIKFRSVKFFANIGDKVIQDNFKVSLHVVAKKPPQAAKAPKK